MSKKSKTNLNLSHRELVGLIEEKGWQLDRHTKHIIYINPESNFKIVLPNKKSGSHLSLGVIRKVKNILEGNYYGGNQRYVPNN